MKMRNILKFAKEKAKMSGKGAISVNSVGTVMISFLVIAFTAVAVFLGLSTLRTSGIFPAGSTEANATSNISTQITSGVTTFFSYTVTLFSILAVVLILGFIGLLIFIAYSFYSGGTGGGNGGISV